MATFTDLYHYFGNDINLGTTGDIFPVQVTQRGQQRILRRLLTNPREVLADGSILPPDYIFHPEYGAGLPRRVGDVADIAKITAVIRGQILQEASVSQSPEPVINVVPIQNGITVTIKYTDAATNAPAILSFNVNK